MTSRVIKIDYTNWKGERRIRQIEPNHMWFGSTEWHPSHQWLLRARDMEDMNVKDFAMAGLHGWGNSIYIIDGRQLDKEAANMFRRLADRIEAGTITTTSFLADNAYGNISIQFTYVDHLQKVDIRIDAKDKGM